MEVIRNGCSHQYAKHLKKITKNDTKVVNDISLIKYKDESIMAKILSHTSFF